MTSARSLIILGVCLALGSACGKKSGSGKAKVRSGDALLEVPAGTDASAIKLTVQPQVKLPDDLMRWATRIQAHLRLVKIVSIEPASLEFAAPADLTVTVAPSELPTGSTLADVRAFTVIAGVPTDLDIATTDNGVVTHVPKPGHVLFAVGPSDAKLVGTPAYAVRGGSELMYKADCQQWLTPESPRVAGLAKGGFAIKEGALVVPSLPTPAPYAPAKDLLRADEIIEAGSADPVQQSVVLGSLLLAAGHPVRMVSGDVHYERGGTKFKGYHQWIEVLVEDKPWYVDASDPATVKLVPLGDAYKTYGVTLNRTCPKNPPGTNIDPSRWTP